jgi:hypothetical protein
MKINNFLLLFLTLFFLQGCSNTQSKLGEFFQTNAATLIEKDYKNITNLIVNFKKKLDARNPNNYDEKQDFYIYDEIRKSNNSLFLSHEGKYLKNYDAYLKVAFSKKEVKNRNDFLILGLYKLVYESYKKADGHTFTTLHFDKDKLKNLYYYLKVLNWKIKTDRDENGNYLFLTWQKNWQVALEKSQQTKTLQSISELPSIKENKEDILEPSNFNFEVIMNQMFFHTKNSSSIVGEEPLDISLETMKTLVFFL